MSHVRIHTVIDVTSIYQLAMWQFFFIASHSKNLWYHVLLLLLLLLLLKIAMNCLQFHVTKHLILLNEHVLRMWIRTWNKYKKRIEWELIAWNMTCFSFTWIFLHSIYQPSSLDCFHFFSFFSPVQSRFNWMSTSIDVCILLQWFIYKMLFIHTIFVCFEFMACVFIFYMCNDIPLCTLHAHSFDIYYFLRHRGVLRLRQQFIN